MYSFDGSSCNSTHVPTTLSWLPSRDLDDENHEDVERPALQYILTIAKFGEDMMEVILSDTNVTVLLERNVTYTVVVQASICDFQLNSLGNITIELDTPTYQCKYNLIQALDSPGSLLFWPVILS